MSIITAPTTVIDPLLQGNSSKMSEFFAFIKLAKTFKGDLSKVSAPAFILSPTSLIEYTSYWCQKPSSFVNPAKQNDKVLRSLSVLKWYLGTLRALSQGGMTKKPLNPILGELFSGYWDDGESGRTEIIAEQVCHQPPITAYRMRNEKYGVSMDGYHLTKTTFRGGPCIERVGHVMLHLDSFNEDYLITLPNMHLEGLALPPPYAELKGKSYIVGSNGVTAEIDYAGRGWVKGKKNSFSAKVYEKDQEDKPAFTVEGQWLNGAYTIFDAAKRQLEKVDTKNVPKAPEITVPALDDQGLLESRRVWNNVAGALRSGQYTTAGREKNKLEDEQRALRAKEADAGIEWQPMYFKPGDWLEAEKLLAKVGQEIRKEETKGIWRWSA